MRSLLLGVLLALPGPLWAQGVQIWAAQPVFSQAIAVPLPFAGHRGAPDFTDLATNRSNFIAEWVPQGETIQNWSQMITVTAINAESLENGMDWFPPSASAWIINQIGQRFQTACNGAHLTPIDTPNMPRTRAVEAAFVVCEQLRGADYGEAVMVLGIVGERDLYTVQWAQRFRAPAREGDLAPPAEWRARLAQLLQSRFCGLTASGSPAAPCN